MNNYSTSAAKGGKYPRDLSRRAQLQSSTLRTREQHDPPSSLGLDALRRHAEFADSQQGKLLAFKMRPRYSSSSADEKSRVA